MFFNLLGKNLEAKKSQQGIEEICTRAVYMSKFTDGAIYLSVLLESTLRKDNQAAVCIRLPKLVLVAANIYTLTSCLTAQPTTLMDSDKSL